MSDPEVMCARCGSSTEYEQCDDCGGEGLSGHDCGEDTCCCAQPEDNVTCVTCGGLGGWPLCVSTAEWCQDHPLPGKADTKRGTFVFAPEATV